MTPAIFGLAGLALSADETAFFRDADPVGYILFGRNLASRDQIIALTDALRALSGRDDLPILIDQEGGRVARLRAPEWPSFPAAGAFAAAYDRAPSTAMAAARANGVALGTLLAGLGITVNCAPVADIAHPGAHAIVGDRAFGSDAMSVAALARALLDGMAEAGVVGVVKHLPGHGRAMADTHTDIATVDADRDALDIDFAAFERLADAAMGMTCHVRFTAIDADRPATLSPTVIADVIRGRIGFDGLLLTDDLDMKGLGRDPVAAAAEAIAAGCDVALNCWARLPEMIATARALPALGVEAKRRLTDAMARRGPRGTGMADGSMADAAALRDTLLASA